MMTYVQIYVAENPCGGKIPSLSVTGPHAVLPVAGAGPPGLL